MKPLYIHNLSYLCKKYHTMKYHSYLPILCAGIMAANTITHDFKSNNPTIHRSDIIILK